MSTYVLRLWLPDRPGALGAVASRVGAVGGDVIGIEILERGAGRAIDELVVDLHDDATTPGIVDLLVNEVMQVDGVDVEHVRSIDDNLRDPLLDALETAAILVGASTPAAAVESLTEHAMRTVGAAWGAMVALDEADLAYAVGETPTAAWLVAFVEGSQSSARVNGGQVGPDDVVWAPLPSARMALVLGRNGTAFRARERRQAAALARIVDTRFRELRVSSSRAAHPSAKP